MEQETEQETEQEKKKKTEQEKKKTWRNIRINIRNKRRI